MQSERKLDIRIMILFTGHCEYMRLCQEIASKASLRLMSVRIILCAGELLKCFVLMVVSENNMSKIP